MCKQSDWLPIQTSMCLSSLERLLARNEVRVAKIIGSAIYGKIIYIEFLPNDKVQNKKKNDILLLIKRECSPNRNIHSYK